jgi:hypothetical protein
MAALICYGLGIIGCIAVFVILWPLAKEDVQNWWYCKKKEDSRENQ